MILPSDTDYKNTKQIKKSMKSINPKYKKLSAWIEKRYRVKVLNIIVKKYNNKPKGVIVKNINIILEFEKDIIIFRKGDIGNYYSDKQKSIINEYKKIELLGDKNDDISIQYTVTCSIFESIAKIEANNNIPENEIKKLHRKFGLKNVWLIDRCFANLIIFVYTDKQLNSLPKKLKKFYIDEYFSILKKYDEFNYYKKKSFMCRFDSKENFDTNYQSNWFYYYR